MSYIIALISFLLNKLEELFTFIVVQIYNLVINNTNTNISRTNLLNNIDNLNLFNTTLVNNYNLNTKFEDSIT